MASTFHGIETARRSLMTQRTALDTTGHNIANANTEGYTRQRVNMQASIPMEAYGAMRSLNPGQLGTGVEFTSITRIRESYLDVQYRNENSSLNSWTTQSAGLSKLETIISEPSTTGLSTVMNNFWKSWSDLSKDTESVTARNVVKENALALTDAMNQTAGQLTNMTSDLTSNIATKAKEMQSYMNSITELNKSIMKIESLGDDANDLRDQRDLLADKLSGIVNITVIDSPTGYNISMGSQALVNGIIATQLPTEQTELETVLGNATGGEVHGLFASRTAVAGYQSPLDKLADTLANGDMDVNIPRGSSVPEGMVFTKDIQIVNGGKTSTLPAGTAFPKGAAFGEDTSITVKGLNGLHQIGFTTDGNSSAGAPFFTGGGDGSGPITASNIRLNSIIANDATKIASSMRLDSNGSAVKGNNTLALIAANMESTKMLASGSTNKATLSDMYSATVGQLGIQSQEASRKTTNAESLLTQVDTSRQSVSGVSQDEEMTNLVKFQQAYNASARFMTAYDEILEKLINGTGTVGR